MQLHYQLTAELPDAADCCFKNHVAADHMASLYCARAEPHQNLLIIYTELIICTLLAKMTTPHQMDGEEDLP